MSDSSYFSHDGISFRPPLEQDLNMIRALRNEFGTWSQLTDPRPLGDSDQKAWLLSLGARAGKFYFVVYTKEEPFVGMVRMDEYDPINRSIRVGADVSTDLRRRGFGRRIYEGLKRYCFGYLNIHRMWLEVLESNDRAVSLYQKQGFQEEGRLREAVFRDGKYLDYIVMSLLEEEYRNG